MMKIILKYDPKITREAFISTSPAIFLPVVSKTLKIKITVMKNQENSSDFRDFINPKCWLANVPGKTTKVAINMKSKGTKTLHASPRLLLN